MSKTSEAEERKVHNEIVAVLKQIKFKTPIVITIPSVLPISHSTEGKRDDTFEPVGKYDPVKEEMVPHRLALQSRDEVTPIRPFGQGFGTICVAEVQMTGRRFLVLAHGEHLVNLAKAMSSKDVRSLDN